MSSEERLRFLLTSGLQFSTEDSKATKLLWKELTSLQRIDILGSTLQQITEYLADNKKLDQEQIRLKKILSLNISLEETLNLGITNYFCYISQSMRDYGINTRFLLNQMTNFITQIEKQLMQGCDTRIEEYRQIQDKHDDLSLSTYNDTNHQQYSEEGYEQNTKVERSQEKKVLIKSHSSMTPTDNNHITFTRKTTRKQ